MRFDAAAKSMARASCADGAFLGNWLAGGLGSHGGLLGGTGAHLRARKPLRVLRAVRRLEGLPARVTEVYPPIEQCPVLCATKCWSRRPAPPADLHHRSDLTVTSSSARCPGTGGSARCSDSAGALRSRSASRTIVTERVDAERRIRHLAASATGSPWPAPTGNFFLAPGDLDLEQARHASATTCAPPQIDNIDRFKSINDARLGSEAGGEVAGASSPNPLLDHTQRR